jgi:ligand-binding sensor domain-containing protein
VNPPSNPPGQPSLQYRVGTYADFLDGMKALLHGETVDEPGLGSSQPLARLQLESQRDIAAALLKAWAVTGDILTFYQERIANEGFLRTATDRFSLTSLARSVGYEMNPGRSASGWLAFTLATGRGAPLRVPVPRGSAVQGLSPVDQSPVTFETSQDFVAYGQWNNPSLLVAVDEVPVRIGKDTAELRIKGVSRTGLRPGTRLLFAWRDTPLFTGAIRKATPNVAGGYTSIEWEPGALLGVPADSGNPVTNPDVYLFTRNTSLFGRNAREWSSLSDSVKADYGTRIGGVRFAAAGATEFRTAPNKGLPDAPVRALAVAGGAIFAGTASGIYRSTDKGGTFQPLSGLSRRDVYSLSQDADGALYAGASGLVLRSVDGGESWETLRGSVRLGRAIAGVPLSGAQVKDTRLPGMTVRSIVATEGSLFAAGDEGVYAGAIPVTEWAAKNDGLPGGVVWSLLADGKRIWAATAKGVYLSGDRGAKWVKGSPSTNAAVALAAGGGYIFAAMSDGVFRTRDEGAHWQPCAALPAAAASLGFSTTLFAATQKGLFRSADMGTTWTEAGEFHAMSVSALAASASGVVAASPFSGFVESDWPDFHPDPGSFDLDQARGGIASGSWVLLTQNQLNLASCVDEVSTVFRSAFLQKATVTRITVQPTPDVASFNLRETTLYYQSELLDLYHETLSRPDPIRGPEIQLSTAVPDLESTPRDIAVAGSRASVSIRVSPGGVYRLRGSNWEPVGLAEREITSLVTTSAGDLVAGTADGVFNVETEASLGLDDKGVLSLAVANGDLVAAASAGIWRYRGGQWEPLGTAPAGVSRLAAGAETYAASDQGRIFQYVEAGQTWKPVDMGVQFGNVAAMLVVSDGSLWVGASAGVYRYFGNTWTPAPALEWDVLCMAVDRRGVLYAGTSGGLFQLSGSQWTLIVLDEFTKDSHVIAAIATDSSGTIRAAAAQGRGVFQLRSRTGAQSASWEMIKPGLASNIGTLLFDSSGLLFAAASNTMMAISDRNLPEIRLDRQLAGTLDLTVCDFLDRAEIAGALLAGLTSLKITPSADARIEIQTQGKSWLLFSAPDPGNPPWAAYSLRVIDGAISVYLNILLEVIDAEDDSWTLRSRSGQTLSLYAQPAELAWERAAVWNETIGERAQVLSVSDSSRLTLAAALTNVYDPLTVTILGNLAEATHGETVPVEVLGSGDASKTNQKFTLNKPPLTFAPGSTLEVKVTPGQPGPLLLGLQPTQHPDDWISWTEVPSFAESGPHDNHFVTTTGDGGKVTICFGDGVLGRRLPTGTENVVCTYRSGLGTRGNIDGGVLNILRRVPQGVRRATNPLPADGGADPESVDDIRPKLPSSTRTLDRVVSLTDYEDFARSFAGVAKAKVALVPKGLNAADPRLLQIHITLAGRNGAPLPPPPGEGVCLDLLQAMRSAAIAGRQPVIDTFEPVYFEVEATLTITEDTLFDVVQDSVNARLVDVFGFDGRELAAPVYASDVISAIQGVDGVLALDLTALYFRGAPRRLNPMLTALAARWNPDRATFESAQMLLLDVITLSSPVESA